MYPVSCWEIGFVQHIKTVEQSGENRSSRSLFWGCMTKDEINGCMRDGQERIICALGILILLSFAVYTVSPASTVNWAVFSRSSLHPCSFVCSAVSVGQVVLLRLFMVWAPQQNVFWDSKSRVLGLQHKQWFLLLTQLGTHLPPPLRTTRPLFNPRIPLCSGA